MRSEDPQFNYDLNSTLNLNIEFLKSNRKATLDAFKDGLRQRGPLSRPTMEKWLADWNGESNSDELKPYTGYERNSPGADYSRVNS